MSECVFCVVAVEKEKGKVQCNSIVILLVNDLYNKCIASSSQRGRSHSASQPQCSKLKLQVHFHLACKDELRSPAGFSVQPGLNTLHTHALQFC